MSEWENEIDNIENGDDDDDDSEMWRKVREDGQRKKEQNTVQSLELLRRHGVEFICLSEKGRHYRIGEYDFWPSTGKFINRTTKESGRGVFNLIKLIRKPI